MKAIMGIEVHCQLNTRSKLFCSCPTDSREKEPDENTCPICLGFPGSKPKVNKKAIDFGIMVSTALNCKTLPEMFFSRKSYFYPDMAKNFQISQYEIPLAEKGHLEVNGKKIRIRRIHLEEDPAKLVHVGGDITSAKYVLVDYNRAGVPLLEIVTEPDFEKSKEVRMFLEKLSSILEHLEAYDSEQEASLRVDANISLEGGERIEIKNITGFHDVEKALNYEIIRQKNITKTGLKVEREVRHFDAEQRVTKSLRKKEFEEDYGYIFEPDLTMIKISDEWIRKLKAEMPELPDHRVERFVKEYKISEHQAKVLVYVDKHLADFFEECCKDFWDYPLVTRWVVTDLLKCLNFQGIKIKNSKLSQENFVKFLQLIKNRKITERLGKEIIKEITLTGEDPENYLNKRGLKMMNWQELEKVVHKILDKNKKAVADYKDGQEKALEYLIGQVLRETKATADPKKIREQIKALIAQ